MAKSACALGFLFSPALGTGLFVSARHNTDWPYRLNGVGGQLEHNELPHICMVRVFKENRRAFGLSGATSRSRRCASISRMTGSTPIHAATTATTFLSRRDRGGFARTATTHRLGHGGRYDR